MSEHPSHSQYIVNVKGVPIDIIHDLDLTYGNEDPFEVIASADSAVCHVHMHQIRKYNEGINEMRDESTAGELAM